MASYTSRGPALISKGAVLPFFEDTTFLEVWYVTLGFWVLSIVTLKP